MNKNKQKNKNQSNPEILRDAQEKVRYSRLDEIEDELGGIMLYPDYFLTNAASSSEMTGLMQTVPLNAAEIEAYSAIYNNFPSNQPIPDEETE